VPETCIRLCKRLLFSPTVTGSVIVKKGNGERLTERCFLWKNIAVRWKKTNHIVLVLSERDDAFVTDIPLGPSDHQTTQNHKCKCLIQQ